MQIEVEQKFRVADLADFERRLAELEPFDHETQTQVDRYFNHPSRDFANTDEALRLRRVDTRNWLTYKGPKVDATTKSRREIEIELASGDGAAAEAAALLGALGFIDVAIVRKRRLHASVRWEGQVVLVALDEVADLGSFVELEVLASPSEVGQIQARMASLAQRLGLHNSERRSYLELLLEARK